MHKDEVQFKDDAVPPTGPTTVHSNILATLVVGLVMLIIGVLAGYFGRPVVTPQPLNSMPVASAGAANPSAATNTDPPTGNPSPSTLMEAVVAQTRHFKGDPNAPITIIEFGDFQ
jgi:hypothetical protein